MPIDERRILPLNDAPDGAGHGPVLYWMSREQRVRDNWGLLHARDLAGETRPLVVGFCLAPGFIGATLRQYDFMLRGLREVAASLDLLGIPFALRLGDPGEEIPRLAAEIGAAVVITDFDPLRVKRRWQRDAGRALGADGVRLIEVDGHNVVPARVVSDKQEYAARTIRPKIHRLLPEFLTEFPALRPQQAPPAIPAPDWAAARRSLEVDASVGPLDRSSGEAAAHAALEEFVAERLPRYAAQRNDPNADATSRLSAHFHFGQLAPQRAALSVAASPRTPGDADSRAAYLEELIVRRELSDNFCLHNPDYDSLRGAPEWARAILDAHRNDPRPHVYTPEVFDRGCTHSALWNAAQNQLLETGWMHGYMRMFWAKKILEWSPSPERALETVVALNDRYQLDGRDPNGYVGALWSVAGLHDRPWKRRPVFGTVRYMNEAGCRRKFGVEAYVARWGG